eukprot:scaffold85745_cov22-Tisochrysis_lutea.AAC.1
MTLVDCKLARVCLAACVRACVRVCVSASWGLREEVALSGRETRALVYVKPDDDMAKVVHTLTHHKCSMAPILSADPGGSE